MPKPLILLAEDSEDDAFFFSRALRLAGLDCELHHLTNGSLTIEFLQSRSASGQFPTVVFLDLKMPVSNGFDVLEWLQKQPFAGAVPVVVLSGSEQQMDKDRAIKLGANGYVVKPIKATDLQRFIKGADAGAKEMK